MDFLFKKIWCLKLSIIAQSGHIAPNQDLTCVLTCVLTNRCAHLNSNLPIVFWSLRLIMHIGNLASYLCSYWYLSHTFWSLPIRQIWQHCFSKKKTRLLPNPYLNGWIVVVLGRLTRLTCCKLLHNACLLKFSEQRIKLHGPIVFLVGRQHNALCSTYGVNIAIYWCK